MNLTTDEKTLLLSILNKHEKVMLANDRNLASGYQNNMSKKREKLSGEIADLRNIRVKLEML